jgi:hypothetical protein
MKVLEFSEEVYSQVSDQLISDDKRWGDTWLQRTRKGQEWRIFKTYLRYFFEYFLFGKEISWLKVIGNAVIAQTRVNHPKIWTE